MRVGDRVRARNYSDSLVNGLIHRHQHLSAASRWLEQSASSAKNGVHLRSLAGAPALRRFRSTRPSARAPRAALARLRRRLQRRLAIKQHCHTCFQSHPQTSPTKFPFSIIVIPQVGTETPQLDQAGIETPGLDVQKIEIATLQQVGRNK